MSAVLVIGPCVAAVAAGADILVFERTSCFGDCPSYRVSVDGSGHVTYEGRKDVATLGVQSSEIGRAKVEGIRKLLEEHHFFALRERYGRDENCPVYCTDYPTVTVSYSDPETSKRVVAYQGCREEPDLEKVGKLAKALDELFDTSAWVGPRGGPFATTCFQPHGPAPDGR